MALTGARANSMFDPDEELVEALGRGEPAKVIQFATSGPIEVPLPPAREFEPKPFTRATSRVLNLKELAGIQPPPFEWWIPGWLSPHPTLLSGRGGVGKSLLAMQLAVGCALGRPFLGAAARPLKVLYWACEDDTDEIHRRLASICSSYGVSMAELDGMLHVDSRLGLDNCLLATEYGRPLWTPTIELLRQQVNDLGVDICMLDNIAHLFSASENDRAAVTMFTAGLSGLCIRPWCPFLIGHVSKAPNSEYAGSTAWENAVRMRWYLGRKMPDAKEDDEEAPDDNVRVLAKRKSNYSADDVLRLRVGDRSFTVEEDIRDEGTVVGNIREANARKAVLAGLGWLKERNIDSSDQYSVAYLPAQLIRYEQAGGHTKRELDRAMRQLIASGQVQRGVVGKKANRMPKIGLILTGSEG